MVKGMTAQYLLKQIGHLQSGDVILFHAAAGGVGLIAGEWGKALGLTMIGSVGSDEKMAIAKANDYDYVINYNREDFQPIVMEITRGIGVKTVYDSIGKDTFERSLNCLAPMGGLICFGAASGARPLLNIETLAHKGSLFVQRLTLQDYVGTPDRLRSCAADLLQVLMDGTIRVEKWQCYSLKEVSQAHNDIEARKTVGSTILLP